MKTLIALMIALSSLNSFAADSTFTVEAQMCLPEGMILSTLPRTIEVPVTVGQDIDQEVSINYNGARYYFKLTVESRAYNALGLDRVNIAATIKNVDDARIADSIEYYGIADSWGHVNIMNEDSTCEELANALNLPVMKLGIKFPQ